MNEVIKELNSIDWENDFKSFDYDNKIDDYDIMINEAYEDDEDIRGY